MWVTVDPYLFPARGRKRRADGIRELAPFVDPYLFPARGRKHDVWVFFEPYFEGNVDPYLFPARGRKLERSE